MSDAPAAPSPGEEIADPVVAAAPEIRLLDRDADGGPVERGVPEREHRPGAGR
jgi:hypothetical protein